MKIVKKTMLTLTAKELALLEKTIELLKEVAEELEYNVIDSEEYLLNSSNISDTADFIQELYDNTTEEE